MYPGGTINHCDSLMANGQPNEAAFYQMESPPCYTIATGLPTYDEALHHHHQHFSFGMKFAYPTISAVHHHHHHPAIAGSGGGCGGNTTAIISNWEKDDFVLKTKEKEKHQLQQQQQQQEKQNLMKVGATAPPTYDAASVALLGVNEKSEAISISIEAMEVDMEAYMGDDAPTTTAHATSKKADDTTGSAVVVA